jgi:hypothetical protein
MPRRCWRWIIACGFVIADLVNYGHVRCDGTVKSFNRERGWVSLSWIEPTRDHQKPHDHCRCFFAQINSSVT